MQTSVQWVVFSADFSAVDGIQCRLQCSGWYSVQTSVQWVVFSADFSAVGGIHSCQPVLVKRRVKIHEKEGF